MKASGKSFSFWLAQLVLLALVVVVLLPGRRAGGSVLPFLAALGIIELLNIIKWVRRPERRRSTGDLLVFIYLALLLWELGTTQLNLLHPVLFPTPEEVFAVFPAQAGVMLGGVFASLQLLLVGVVVGTVLGVLLGLVVGWNKRLTGLFYPVAQVMAPIPPVVYAPYLVAIMPSFRSASALVVFLGIFFPTFLGSILRVHAIEPRILDSARSLNVRGATMLGSILLPYVLPGVVSGLKVTLSTSIMLLIFAEMMGATSGMGYYIINYVHYANYTNVVAGIILVGVVVVVLNRLVELVQKRAIPWQP